MKKVYLSLAAMAIFAASCDKLEQIANIEKNVDLTQTVSVNGLPNVDTIFPNTRVKADLPPVTIATDSKTFLENNGSEASNDAVEYVKLTKFKATVLEPVNGNFNFVDTLYAYISAPGMSEVLAAHKYGIPKGQTSIDMETDTSLNLKQYFLKDSMVVRIGGSFVAIPDSGTKLEIKPTLKIKANVVKALK